jgi:c-di-GMP-binding flagellar brake protein YcgR
MSVFPSHLQLVSLTKRDEKGEEQEYRVRIVEIREDGYVVECPLGPKGYPVRVPVGESVGIGYVIEGAFYHFRTTVLQLIREGEETPPLLVVQKPAKESIKKKQRRQYFRIPVMLDVTFVAWDPEQTEQNLPSEEMTGMMIDLSGGGFSFRIKVQLPEKGAIKGVLRLPLKKQLLEASFEGVIRRVTYMPKPGLYHCSVEFTNIRESDRDKVMRYCFARQLELKNKVE